jgi:hypothetical protein
MLTFPETDFALLGKLTRNPESFKPLPGSNCAYAGTTIFMGLISFISAENLELSTLD